MGAVFGFIVCFLRVDDWKVFKVGGVGVGGGVGWGDN
jgi:hypothetical protein